MWKILCCLVFLNCWSDLSSQQKYAEIKDISYETDTAEDKIQAIQELEHSKNIQDFKLLALKTAITAVVIIFGYLCIKKLSRKKVILAKNIELLFKDEKKKIGDFHATIPGSRINYSGEQKIIDFLKSIQDLNAINLQLVNVNDYKKTIKAPFDIKVLKQWLCQFKYQVNFQEVGPFKNFEELFTAISTQT